MGSTALCPWGDDPSHAKQCQYANGANKSAVSAFPEWIGVACDDGVAGAAPVASFTPNAFGLHDMIGSLWEWVADCYYPSHAGSSANGRARTSAPCDKRVPRGGGWSSGPRILKSAVRGSHVAEMRTASYGFRIARSLVD